MEDTRKADLAKCALYYRIYFPGDEPIEEFISRINAALEEPRRWAERALSYKFEGK